MTRFSLATMLLAGSALILNPTIDAGQKRIAAPPTDDSARHDRYLRPAELLSGGGSSPAARAGSSLLGVPSGGTLQAVRQPEVRVVDTLRRQPEGFAVPQSWDSTAAFIGAWQQQGWEESVFGPEFTSDRDGVLTEVGGFLAWLPADGCTTPQAFSVEIRKATTFGCGCCRTECPDMSATGLLGAYPLTSPPATSQEFTYQFARPELAIEAGDIYFALFRAPAAGCAGALLVEANDPQDPANEYKAGQAIFGASTEGGETGSGGASAAVRVRVRKFPALY